MYNAFGGKVGVGSKFFDRHVKTAFHLSKGAICEKKLYFSKFFLVLSEKFTNFEHFFFNRIVETAFCVS